MNNSTGIPDRKDNQEPVKPKKKRTVYTVHEGNVVDTEVYDMDETPEEREKRRKMREWKRLQRRKMLIALLFVAFVLVVFFMGYNYPNDPAAPVLGDVIPPYTDPVVSGCDMKIHAIDVGQGDCVLVQGGGANILIDAGENGKGDSVVDYLVDIGVTKLDWLICSHPHSDHIGGVDTVINDPDVKVEKVMMPDVPDDVAPTSRTYEDVLDAIIANGCELYAARENSEYSFGAMTMKVFTPTPEKPYEDLNDYSIGLRFKCGNISFLTCGDASITVEKKMLAVGCDLDADIMKISHHGSSYSTSEEFLRAVSPQYAFCMVGADNSFGHPSQKVLDLAEGMGVDMRRTDICGNIVYATDGSSIWVKTEYNTK